MALKFVDAVSPVFEIVREPEVDSYAVELCNAIVARVKDASEKDAKEIDKMGIQNFFKSIKSVIERSNIFSARDQITSMMLYSKLGSKSLARKLQALHILKHEYGILSIGTPQLKSSKKLALQKARANEQAVSNRVESSAGY